MNLLINLLYYIKENNCSDLHIVENESPYVRKNGEIQRLNNYEKLSKNTINDMIESLLYTVELNENDLNEDIKQFNLIKEKKKTILLSDRQVDISFEMKDTSRFRVNIFSQKNRFSIAIRRINTNIPSLNTLGLPNVINSFINYNSGLILVTGPTGSGKSTTLASIIDLINTTQSKHIITIEDPIEYVHYNKLSIVNQREIGQDVEDYNLAVKSCLREDPDIVLIGEMRDFETISNAIRLAETGHLVFGTLHTISASSSIDRIIDVFPPQQQQQIRVQLSNTLRAIVSQRLLQGIKSNQPFVCASEVMIVNNAIKGVIREGKQINTINDIITTNKKTLGSQTFDQCLAELVINKLISTEQAFKYCSEEDTLKRMIALQGFR